jgi:hypothetical protein
MEKVLLECAPVPAHLPEVILEGLLFCIVTIFSLAGKQGYYFIAGPSESVGLGDRLVVGKVDAWPHETPGVGFGDVELLDTREVPPGKGSCYQRSRPDICIPQNLLNLVSS